MGAKYVHGFRKNQETDKECSFLFLSLKRQNWRAQNLGVFGISLIRIDETLCAGKPLSGSEAWCEIPCRSDPSFQRVPLESVICKFHILHLKIIDLSDDADSLLDRDRLL